MLGKGIPIIERSNKLQMSMKQANIIIDMPQVYGYINYNIKGCRIHRDQF